MSLGPDRIETGLRLGVSLPWLGALIWIIAPRRMTGFAWGKVRADVGLFFGGAAFWSGQKLWREGTNR